MCYNTKDLSPWAQVFIEITLGPSDINILCRVLSAITPQRMLMSEGPCMILVVTHSRPHRSIYCLAKSGHTLCWKIN